MTGADNTFAGFVHRNNVIATGAGPATGADFNLHPQQQQQQPQRHTTTPEYIDHSVMVLRELSTIQSEIKQLQYTTRNRKKSTNCYQAAERRHNVNDGLHKCF